MIMVNIIFTSFASVKRSPAIFCKRIKAKQKLSKKKHNFFAQKPLTSHFYPMYNELRI